MDVDRDVILDLLPLYLEGEGSASTRALVEQYLQSDPELARRVKQSDLAEALKDMSVPITKENAMETYRAARRWMVIRTLGLAAILAVVGLVVLVLAFAAIMLFAFRMS
jgi:anti-sigma factor RsiW